MSTLPSQDTPQTDQLQGPEEDFDSPRHRLAEIRQGIAVCKEYRRKLTQNWSLNIDYRRGKPFSSESDEDRVAVPVDWYKTKEKAALLFSQVPELRVSHPPLTTSEENLPWISKFEEKLNTNMLEAGAEAAMDEVLADLINAAGFGAVVVYREALVDYVDQPEVDFATYPPELVAQIEATGLMPDGSEIPMTKVPRELDARYVIDHINPDDFLWPVDFVGSDFDKAPWLGRSGRLTWNEAKLRFNLREEDKQKYLSETKNPAERLTHDTDRDRVQEEKVSFEEIVYKESCYNPQAEKFAALHHVIWLGGEKKPVVDAPWQGQSVDQETGAIVGAQRNPFRVCTVTYISNESIPPSDSAIARPQVNELNKSRTQMMRQREHSLPLRWMDTSRIDPAIMHALMRGVWQHIIPTQGPGSNVIGEITRAHYAPENFTFDGIIKNDIEQLWNTGQGATGPDVETRAEVEAITGNMQTRIAQERAKVARFYCSIAEILGGLMCLYDDEQFGEGFNKLFSKGLRYSILPDSTVLLDSSQRLKRKLDFYNFAAKTGNVELIPLLREIAQLSGVDPSYIKQPDPLPPTVPNISLRLTGTEDMMNPLMLALLIQTGQAPDIELIEKAKKLIEASVMPSAPSEPAGMQPALGPDPGGPPTENLGLPGPPPPAIGEAMPDLSAMPRVNQRVLERNS